MSCLDVAAHGLRRRLAGGSRRSPCAEHRAGTTRSAWPSRCPINAGVLEDHGDVAFTRRCGGDLAAVESDRAAGDPIEPGDRPQQARSSHYPTLRRRRRTCHRAIDIETSLSRAVRPLPTVTRSRSTVRHQGTTPSTQPSSCNRARCDCRWTPSARRGHRASPPASVSASQRTVGSHLRGIADHVDGTLRAREQRRPHLDDHDRSLGDRRWPEAGHEGPHLEHGRRIACRRPPTTGFPSKLWLPTAPATEQLPRRERPVPLVAQRLLDRTPLSERHRIRRAWSSTDESVATAVGIPRTGPPRR